MSNLEKHLITGRKADELAKAYEKSNYIAINDKRPGQKPDSKYYIYDLEVLQDYLNLIREGMEKRGIKNKGVRISLGKYPDNGFDPRLNPLYNGYQTIFFSAENLDSVSEKEHAKGTESQEELPNLDFGQLCPPY